MIDVLLYILERCCYVSLGFVLGAWFSALFAPVLEQLDPDRRPPSRDDDDFPPDIGCAA